jgi:hypothetical protein
LHSWVTALGQQRMEAEQLLSVAVHRGTSILDSRFAS